jgi:hypothetical protein
MHYIAFVGMRTWEMSVEAALKRNINGGAFGMAALFVNDVRLHSV